MRFYSWAQEYEDLILYVALQDVENVFYIDVGANDPAYLSVTKAFYDRGGNGINIEPLRDKCLMLESERNRDLNLCVGIGEKQGTMDLYCDDTGSTFSNQTVEDRGLQKNRVHKKKIITMTDVYDKYVAEKQPVHFIKIDVEGFEKEVLKGCDFSKVRPWIFVIESAKPGTQEDSYQEWESILLDNDYYLGYVGGINRYYVDASKEHLLENFKKVSQFFEDNDVVKVNIVREKCK